MPKRPNPYGDCPVQTKTRVGQKEVDSGVNREENMRNVYERTLKLLFSGAKKRTDPNENIIGLPCLESEPMDQGIPDQPAPDQMFFDSKGQLVRPKPSCKQINDDSLGKSSEADSRKS